VEVVPVEVEGLHFGVGNLDTLGVTIGIDFGLDSQASLGCGRGDQLHNGLMADEWSSPPILADKREQPMFDLIPFAGAGRQVADGDLEIEFVGQCLKLTLPESHS